MNAADSAGYNAAVDLLERNAPPARAARPYLVRDEGNVSYGEVIALARGIGAGLLGLGLARGDRVLLFLQDSLEFVATFWGAMRSGLVPVPLSPLCSPSELEFILADSRARALVFDASTAQTVSGVDRSRVVLLGAGDCALSGARPWADSLAATDRPLEPQTQAHDSAFWLYTSGTTGTPKAAILTHAGLRAAPDGLARQVLAMGPDDRILSASRMFFAYGLGNSVYLPAAVGASVIVAHTPAIPMMVQGLIERHSPTLIFGVASFFASYAKLESARLSLRVRAVVSAGEALPAEVFKAFRARFGVTLLDGLGCTEAMHHVTSNRLEDAREGSAGRALDGFEIEIRDAAGKRVRDGESGDLWLRGPTLFAGYWNRPELTSRVLSKGWFSSGDVARLEDGRLIHEGRRDDLMKLGGIWVAPKEIEECLRGHADVEDAAVVIVDHEGGVPMLKAFLRCDRRDAELQRELKQLCTARLASYKIPRVFECVDALPRTATGKLKRFELRAPQARGT